MPDVTPSTAPRPDQRRPSELLRRVHSRVTASYNALVGRTPAPPAAREAGWWDLLPYTTHRIRITADHFTMAAGGVDARADVRTAIVSDELGEALTESTVVDLGCLEGGFSIELARRGARQVLGIEVRQVSVDRCNLVRDLIGLDNVEFRCADVREELLRWPLGFDAVLATGILYHLPDPAGSLKAMRAVCKRFALIDTHVAVPDGPTHNCSSEVIEHRGYGQIYRGRMYREFDASTSATHQQTLLWASFGNPESFWPFEPDLVRMIGDAGFSGVTKLDAGAIAGRWQVDTLNRVLYLCHV
jgi:SAM-dependent methyltransferase